MDTGRDVSEMIQKLMEDDSVKALISSIKDGGGAPEHDSTPASASEGEVIPAGGEGSSGFSLSPEMIAKLPQVMSALSGITGGKDGGTSAPKGDGGRMADRKKLLLALKPFLSPRRCEAIDSIVNIAGLSDILKLM